MMDARWSPVSQDYCRMEQVRRCIWKSNHWTWTCSGMTISQPRSDIMRFFFWTYLKNKVYETFPIDLQDLRDRIGRHVAELSDHPEMIRNSMPGIIKRCQKCLEHD